MPKTVLVTWELGSGLGHLASIYSVINALRETDYKIVVAIKDFSRVHTFFDKNDGVHLLQAPVWLPKIKMQRSTVCLADIMLLKGYLQVQSLNNMVAAWRGLFELVNPDLLICNYSPTAMLASYGSSIPKFILGTGYYDPVPGKPIADWRCEPKNDGLVERQEKKLFGLIKAAVPETRGLNCYSEIFQAQAVILSTLPQLDVYKGVRKEADYCIKDPDTENHIAKGVVWKHKNSRKILVYLKGFYPHVDQLCGALKATGAEVCVVIPGVSSETFKSYNSDKITFITEAVNFYEMLKGADLFIGHGNMGTLSEALYSGVPAIVLPIQMENQLNGKMAADIGAGVLVGDSSDTDALTKTISDALECSRLKHNALLVAQEAKLVMAHSFKDCLLSRIEAC